MKLRTVLLAIGFVAVLMALIIGRNLVIECGQLAAKRGDYEEMRHCLRVLACLGDPDACAIFDDVSKQATTPKSP